MSNERLPKQILDWKTKKGKTKKKLERGIDKEIRKRKLEKDLWLDICGDVEEEIHLHNIRNNTYFPSSRVPDIATSL